MPKCLQARYRVGCGIVKLVQRAGRGRNLPADFELKQWRQEHERIVGEALLNKRPHPTLRVPHGFLQNQPCCRGSFSIRRPTWTVTWRSCSSRQQRTRSSRFSSTPVSLHSRMEGGTSTAVNGLPTTVKPTQQTTFVQTSEVAGQKMY